MAQVNLGSIKFRWKGTYNGATSYTADDVVEYNGSSYICILASTGNLPTNATYFEQMSQAGTNGTDGTDLTTTLTTQGDIVYRDASGLARLGAGVAGQVLQSGGTGANPSWVDASGGAFGQVQFRTGTTALGNTSVSTYVDASGDHYVTITPSSTSKQILLQFAINLRFRSGSADNGFQFKLHRSIAGGSPVDLFTSGSTYNYYYDSSGGQSMRFNTNFWYLDSPNTTSSAKYSFSFRNPHSTLELNVSDGGTPSHYLALELN